MKRGNAARVQRDNISNVYRGNAPRMQRDNTPKMYRGNALRIQKDSIPNVNRGNLKPATIYRVSGVSYVSKMPLTYCSSF